MSTSIRLSSRAGGAPRGDVGGTRHVRGQQVEDPDEIGNRDVGKGVNFLLPNGRHGVVRSFTSEAAPTVFAFNVFRLG